MQKPAYLAILVCLTLGYSASSESQAQTDALGNEAEKRHQASDQNGNFRWVSDKLFTYLRAGPGTDYRLLGSITAGSKVQLLQTNSEDGFAEIIDDRQRTGWIELKFVSPNQSIKDQLEDAAASLTQQNTKVANLRAELSANALNLESLNTQKNKFNGQVTRQLEEIARLNETIEKQGRSNSIDCFTRGAMLGVIALLIGYILGLFGRKRKSSGRLI
jgi:SH3 domain protein